jgi:hypothetical protein
VLKGRRAEEATSGRQRQQQQPDSVPPLLTADVEVEMEMERRWLRQEGVDTAAADGTTQEQSAQPGARRETRRADSGAEGENDSEAVDAEQQRLQRAQAEQRRRAARRSRLLLLLQAMTRMLPADEPDVIIHNIRTVQRWTASREAAAQSRAEQDDRDGDGLTDAESSSFVRAAKCRLSAGPAAAVRGGRASAAAAASGRPGSGHREEIQLLDS